MDKQLLKTDRDGEVANRISLGHKILNELGYFFFTKKRVAMPMFSLGQ